MVRLEAQPRWWKVEAKSRQDAVLMLSSINLPGGVQVSGSASLYNIWPRAERLLKPQRRKLESDELQMRYRIDSHASNLDLRTYRGYANRMELCGHSSRTNPVALVSRQSPS